MIRLGGLWWLGLAAAWLLGAGCSCEGFPHCLQASDCQTHEICFEGLCQTGSDRDCDGTLDPVPLADYLSVACFRGPRGCTKVGDGYQCQGRCQAGRKRCQEGGWGSCEGQRGPMAELCNGEDDDCDGEIDEADPSVGKSCQVEGARGPCAAGIWRCRAGVRVCQAQQRPQTERCNGADDDCDGTIDEGCCVPPYARRRVFPHDRFHLGAVLALRYSPDGRYLATGDAKGLIKLWDAKTRTYLRTLRGHTRDVQAIAFLPGTSGPEGHTLVSVSTDQKAMLWEVPSGKRLATLTEHASSLWSVAFRPDGAAFATGAQDGIIRLWRWDSKSQTYSWWHSLTGHSQPVKDLRFHPDGKRLFSSSRDGSLRSWQLPPDEQAEGKLLRTWRAKDQAGDPVGLNRIAIHPDGKRIAAGLDDHTARVWLLDAPSKEASVVLKGHLAPVRSVAWLPGSLSLVTVSEAPRGRPEKISHRVWDTATGALLAAPPDGLSFYNLDLAFSPVPGEKILAIGSYDKSIQWWNASTWALVGRQRLPYNSTHASHIKTMVLHPQKDGKLALFTGSEDNTIRAWDVARGEGIGGPMVGHGGWLFALALSPAGDLLASVSADQTLRLWDPNTRRLLRKITFGTPDLRPRPGLAFSRDGATLATSRQDGEIQLWHVASGQPKRSLKLETSSAVWLRFQANDTQLMAIALGGQSAAFDLSTGAPIATPAVMPDGPTDGGVSAVGLSQDGKRLAIGTLRGRVQLHSWPDGKLLWTALEPHAIAISELAFTPGSAYLFTGTADGDLVVRDASSGTLVQRSFVHSRGTWGIAFAPDGRRFFTAGGDAQIIEWTCAQQ